MLHDAAMDKKEVKPYNFSKKLRMEAFRKLVNAVFYLIDT
jgi:hypothetical protein